MSPHRIRTALPEDAHALQAIEDSSFNTDRIKPRQMRYLLRRAKALSLVIENHRGILGYCVCLTPAAPRPARLYSLAIAGDARGSGLGQALLKRLRTLVAQQGYNRLRLEVRAGDLRAQSLYRQHGFSEIARLAHYYEDGEAALRMETPLQPLNVTSPEHAQSAPENAGAA